MKRPLIFIGSSSEGLKPAEALQELLEPTYAAQIWTQGVFGLSRSTLDSLLRKSNDADFAVLVLTGEDIVISRNESHQTPRDNVIFELGLFMGAIGQERTFFVYDRNAKPKIPSDLAGICAVEFTSPLDGNGNYLTALGSVASKIKRSMAALGCRRTQSVKTITGCDIDVTNGRIENCAITGAHGAVILPANEFFDDDCVSDRRSVLGAFVNSKFRGGVKTFQEAVKAELDRYQHHAVEKEPGTYRESYGAGTAVFLKAETDSDSNVIVVAVTTKRAGEGIRATPTSIFEGIASIARIVADKRLSHIQLPLLGAGHGCVPAAISLQCILIAISELSAVPAGRHLKRCELVLFQSNATSAPEVSREIVHTLLDSARTWMNSTNR
jgi:hypothetical protein